MLPPINEYEYQVPGREPELLTHRSHMNGPEPEAQSRINALVSTSGDAVNHEGGYDDDGYDGGGGEGEDDTSKKRRWVRNGVLAFIGLFFVFPVIAFAIMYFFVDVPEPHQVAAAQAKTVTYYYADGSVMGQDFQDGNRVILREDQIPQVVKHAVYAAEDADFETNPGFDVTGIARAVFNQLTGGTGGGSTITQQYIKVATQNEERTITRKATEIVKAFKMNNELSKSEIITAYLNTIYFGRGAYGIQAASQAYFKKDIEQLSPSQAAFLAGIIQAPSRGNNKEYAERRWTYVIGQMGQRNWLTPDERAQAKFPQLASAESAKLKGFTGPRRHIKDRVVQELTDLGYPEDQVRSAGYKIYTTVDRKAQALAEKTVTDVMKGEPENLKEALVAINPKTGGIKAYYGGPYDAKDQADWANIRRSPGSSFKPFDFAALLKKDKGPGEVYDGTSGRHFPGREKPVNNSESEDCGQCTVAEAMKRSVNTVFYDIVANDVGAQAVADVAKAAGVHMAPEAETDPDIAIGGGRVEVTPRDMAAGFATFAAEGIQRDAHFVYKVTTADDEIIHQAKDEGEPAFDSDQDKSKQIAGNVTQVLEPVLPYSERACAGGRDCAGKTGTHQSVKVEGQNAQAWMVGYTPSLSAAAWVGTGSFSDPIKNMNGGPIYGRGLPGAIWQRFMDAYYQGKPNEPFPEVEVIGKEVPPPPPPVTYTPPATTEATSSKMPDKPSKPNTPSKPPSTAPSTAPSSESSAPDPFPGGPGNGNDGDGDPEEE